MNVQDLATVWLAAHVLAISVLLVRRLIGQGTSE